MAAASWTLLLLALLALALHGTSAQLNHATLPSCCVDLYGNYTETIAGALNMNMGVACTNCGPELTTLGNFTALQYVGNSASGTITLSCYNCTALTSLGLFPALVAVGYNPGTYTVTLSCTDCAALTTFGTFDALQNVGMFAPGVLKLSCTNCAALATFGTAFAALAHVGYNNGMSSLTLLCTNCTALTIFGTFTALQFVGYNFGAASLALLCTDCAALTAFGTFAALQDVGNSASGTLILSCTNCAALPLLGSLPALQYVSFTGVGALNLSCTACASLTTLGSFPLLSMVVRSEGATSLLMGSIGISCSNCPMLATMSYLPSLQYITSTQLGPINGAFVLTCNDCSILSNFANFQMLQMVYSGPSQSSTASLSLFCSGCPSFSSITSAGSFPALSSSSAGSNSQLNLVTLTCNGCAPVFNVSFPIVYAFTESLPQYFEVFSDGAGLSIFNAKVVPNSLLASLSSVNRFMSLSFDSVNLQTMDGFVSLGRVDNSLIIQNCDNLTNIDGLTMNLQTVNYVAISNNPRLCNINILHLEVVSQVNPTIVNNGQLLSCAPLDPATPSSLVAVAISPTSVSLSWGFVAQPSVAVVYTLTMNAVVVLTYPSYNQPSLPVSITSLTQQTSYTFVLSATLNSVTRPSSPLIITTPGGVATACSAGYIGTISNCTMCVAGTFASPDGNTCVACVAGTYSNASALASSAGCSLCGSGSAASTPGMTSCSTCPTSQGCLYGAAAPLSPVPQSVPAVSMSSTTANSSDNAGLPPGYIFIIVFFGAGAALGLVVLIFHKRIRMTVSKFAAVMRTPRWLFRLDVHEERLSEVPSLVRGLIGMWILLGLALVTAYQIYNFVENQFGTLTTLQPGTTFSNGQSITSASTQLSATIVLLASPISCTNIFAASLGPTGTPLSPVGCQVSSDGSNTTLTFGTTPNTLLALSQGSVVDMALTISAAYENVVFTPVLQYSIVMQQFEGSTITINETLVGTNTAVLTGPTIVSLAGVAAEKVDIDDIVKSLGYTFSYISTAPHLASRPSTSLSIIFEISVPSYYLKVQQVQAISGLTFVSGLLAIGGGVFATGTIVAFIYSYTSHHFFGRDDKSPSSYDLSEHKTSSSLGTI